MGDDTKLSILPGRHWLLQGMRLNFHEVAEPLVKVMTSLWEGKRWDLALLWRSSWMLRLTAYNGSKTDLSSNLEGKLKTIQQAVPCAIVTAWGSSERKIPVGLQPFLSDALWGESWLPSPPCQQPSPWDCLPCRDLERDTPSASGVGIPPGWQVLLYWCLRNSIWTRNVSVHLVIGTALKCESPLYPLGPWYSPFLTFKDILGKTKKTNQTKTKPKPKQTKKPAKKPIKQTPPPPPKTKPHPKKKRKEKRTEPKLVFFPLL